MYDRPPHANDSCRHYRYETGIGPRCAVGVPLPGSVLKCLPKPKEACEKREEYTDAERATWDAWRKERMARMIEIMALLPGTSRKREGGRWGESGSFDCPACKTGAVRWSRARSNGHVMAACSTPMCFEIIE